MNRDDLIFMAWQTGNLSYLVQDHQLILWKQIKSVVEERSPEPWVVNCARRFGKSTLGFLVLVEESLRYPGSTYLFVAPTEGNAKEIVLDIAPVLLLDAPDEFKPVFKNSRFTFPNGSEIRIGGAYNGGETLRGRAAHGAIIDEAAFVKQTSVVNGLKYIMDSVVRPQLLTTSGFLLVQSTPPPVMTHDYVDIFRQQAIKGRTSVFTVEQNNSISPEYLEELKRSYYENDPTGGSWKREFMAEFCIDERQLIIPNWSQEHAVPAYPRPEPFIPVQRIVSYDHGTSDLSVFLFCFYDKPNGTLVVESSLVVDMFNNKLSTQELSALYKKHRQELWGDLPVYKEICDAMNPQVIIDFNRTFGHRFTPPSKSNREAMVNLVINMIQQGRIKVIDNEANRLLLLTLQTGVWNGTGMNRDFSRQPGIGHCDALAALMYACRGVNMHHNPDNWHSPINESQLDLRGPEKDEHHVLGAAIGLNRNFRRSHGNFR